MTWWIKCKDATRLASRAMDTPLPFAERMALRIHLAICTNCARFARQIQDIRGLLQDDKQETPNDSATQLSDDARERIVKALQKRP